MKDEKDFSIILHQKYHSMKTRLEFLYPNKKTVLIFFVFSATMAIALQQGENFSESEPSIFYRIVYPIVEPVWKIWLYISVPVLYPVEGIIPQSTIRWFNPQSWELIYGLNLTYYYFVSSILASILSLVIGRKIK